MIYDDQPQMVEVSHDFEWRDSGGAFRCVPSSVAEPLLAHAFAVIDREALIEKVMAARAARENTYEASCSPRDELISDLIAAGILSEES